MWVGLKMKYCMPKSGNCYLGSENQPSDFGYPVLGQTHVYTFLFLFFFPGVWVNH